MRPFALFVVVPVIGLLAGCSVLPQACAPPAESMVVAELVFGRKIGDRIGISENEFAAFLAHEVTPRFPEGLTVIDARGQWRDTERGTVVREPSRLLYLTFRDEVAKRENLTAIIEAYKRQFRQQSVLMSLHTSCVTF
jgi:hypothetical protein